MPAAAAAAAEDEFHGHLEPKPGPTLPKNRSNLRIDMDVGEGLCPKSA